MQRPITINPTITAHITEEHIIKLLNLIQDMPWVVINPDRPDPREIANSDEPKWELTDPEANESHTIDRQDILYGFRAWMENGRSFAIRDGKLDENDINAESAETILSLAANHVWWARIKNKE